MVKHILRSTPSTGFDAFQRWNEEEVALMKALEAARR